MAPERTRRLALEILSVGAFALLGLALVLWATRFGLPLGAAGLGLGVIVTTQVLPGALVWRAVRPREGYLAEDLVMGFAVGAALAVGAQVAAAASGVGLVRYLLPWVPALVVLVVPGARRRFVEARWNALPWWWGPVAVLGALASVLAIARSAFSQPVAWEGWAERYVDLDYHLALIGELTHRWPPHYPQLGLEPLTYHWFSHAWMGQISAASGIEADLVLIRLAPVVLAVAVPLLVAVLGTRLGGPAVGAVGALVGGNLSGVDLRGGKMSAALIVPLSPSQAFGALMLVAVLLLLVLRWRRPSEGTATGSWAVLVLLAVVGGGAKGTVLPVAVVGALVATLAAVVTRDRSWRRSALDLLTLTVLLGALVRFVFGGGDGGLQVAPGSSLLTRGESLARVSGPGGPGEATLLVLALVAIAGPALLALAAVVLDRELRRTPTFWMLVGVFAAGCGAVLLFERQGQSQWYFYLVATFAAGVGYSWVLLRLAARARLLPVVAGIATGSALVVLLRRLYAGPDSLGSADVWTSLAVVGGVLTVTGAAVALVLRSSRPQVPTFAVVVLSGVLALQAVPLAASLDLGVSTENQRATREAPSTPWSLVEAARWLRASSEPDEMLATNRHCRTGVFPECDFRVFAVSGFTERSVLLETWVYTAEANRRADDQGLSSPRIPFWDQDLLETNDGFFTDPTDAAADRLWELGVRWLFVDLRGPGRDTDLGPWADLKHKTRWAEVYRLSPPGERE